MAILTKCSEIHRSGARNNLQIFCPWSKIRTFRAVPDWDRRKIRSGKAKWRRGWNQITLVALVLGLALWARLGAVLALVLVAGAAHREAADVAGGEDVPLCGGAHAVAADLAHLPAAAPPLLYPCSAHHTQEHSALRSQDPRPPLIRPRNAARIRNSPRRPRRRPWRAQAMQLRQEVGQRPAPVLPRSEQGTDQHRTRQMRGSAAATSSISAQQLVWAGWGERTAHRTDAGTEAARAT
jgi:hypothetical protein